MKPMGQCACAHTSIGVGTHVHQPQVRTQAQLPPLLTEAALTARLWVTNPVLIAQQAWMGQLLATGPAAHKQHIFAVNYIITNPICIILNQQ